MYLQAKRIKGGIYWYLVEGYRHQGRVVQRVVQYVGKHPWGVVKPARFQPPHHNTAAQRLRRLRRLLPGDDGTHTETTDPYTLALRIGQRWYDDHPTLRTHLASALNAADFRTDWQRLRDYIPEDSRRGSHASEGATFAHLTALCLTHRSCPPHTPQWLLDALYREPDIRAGLTRAGLWGLVDRTTGARLSVETFTRKRGAYDGPVDTTTTILGHPVTQATADGYRLRGSRGTEYALIRKRSDPSQLFVKNARTNTYAHIKGFRRFTDQGGTLRPVV